MGKRMKRRFVWWFAAAVLAAAAFSVGTGCAWFGGAEEEDISGTGDRAGEFSEGELDQSGSLSGEETGALEVTDLQTVYFEIGRASCRERV